MSDVLTFLLIELDPEEHHAPGTPPGDVVIEAVRAAGGSIGTTIGATVTTVFHLASSAALAAVQVARSSPAPPRMALCTGDDRAQSRANALLRLTHPRQILLTASTAVMASPALPRQAELLDRGVRSLDAARPPERVYELHAGAGDEIVDDDSASSNLEWARRAAHGPVLGRDEPLAALETAWKATLHGERRMVLLCGEGGIGKTTVAAELALRLHAEGALVLYGRWDQEALAPYQAMREALGTYASACPTPRLRADLEGWGDELSRLLPDVGARVGGVRSPLRGDPEGERLRLFEAIETWLDLLANRRGLLLVLDDLHWSERSSWLLLDHLRQAPGSAPRMILVTSREGEALDHLLATRGWGEGSGDGSVVDHIRLGGLDQAVVAKLVEQTTGQQLGPVDDDLVDWLTTGTAGNPLFVQEVLRSIGGTADAGSALRVAKDVVPGQLADVVQWRLTQLPAATGALLADAAVIGGAFDLDLLASATQTPAVALQAPLEDGVRSGLLQPPTQAGRYVFTHDVVRRALQESRDSEASTSLHRRIAVALANRALEGGEVTAAEVAHHHLLGADYQTIAAAVRWARNAAEAARRETAFETAVSLLQRAIAAHDRFYDVERTLAAPTVVAPLRPIADDDLGVACELRLELAEAHDRAGEFTARDQCYRDAGELARRVDRIDLFVRAALGFGGRLPVAATRNPTACELLEDALDLTPPESGRWRALLLSRLAQFRYHDSPYADRRALCDEAEAIARELDNPVVLATVLIGRCLTLDDPNDVDDQLRVGAEVMDIGQHIGDPDVTLQGARVRIPALFVTGGHDEARTLAGSFASLAQEVRHPDHIRLATMWEILWTGIEGPYDQFEAQADRLHSQLETAGHPQAGVIHFGQTFVPRWLHGRLDLSRRGVEAMGGVRSELDVIWAMAVWSEAATGHESDAIAHLGERDPAEFVAQIQRDVMWWPTLTGCAIAASCGERDWAAVMHEAFLPYAGLNCVSAYTSFFGAADHHLGTLAVALGRHDEAVERLEQALKRHQALGAGGFAALSATWLAHALTLRDQPGDRDKAGALHAESTDLADRLGLAGLPKLTG